MLISSPSTADASKIRRFDTYETTSGFASFAPLSDLTDPAQGFLLDGALVMRAHIEVHSIGEDRLHLEFRESPAQELDQFIPVDIEAEIDNTILPCRSALLAQSSDVLCGMFASTDKDTWGKGVTAAFEGFPIEDVQAFLAVAHGATVEETQALLGLDETKYYRRVMDGLVPLAAKLNAPQILKVCACV